MGIYRVVFTRINYLIIIERQTSAAQSSADKLCVLHCGRIEAQVKIEIRVDLLVLLLTVSGKNVTNIEVRV